MARFSAIWSRFEPSLVAHLPSDVRANLHVEQLAALTYGIFYATTISFLPIVLRHLGAGTGLIALYSAQTYLGAVTASLSVLLMRRRRTKNFAVSCWLVGRSSLLLTFFVTHAGWLLVLTAVFWLLETFPAPAYARIAQAIYPSRYRGFILSEIKIWQIATLLLFTPVAGWALDHISYQVLFSIGALLAVLSTLTFARLNVDEGTLPPRQTRSLSSVWSIIGRDRRFAIHLLGFIVYGFGNLLGISLYPLVQVDRLSLSYTEIGYLTLIQSLCWLLGYYFWGRQVDRRGAPWVLRTNIAICVLVPLTYVWANSGWTLLPAFIALGIISAGTDLGLVNSGIQLAPADQVLEYSALQSTMMGLRGMVVPFIGSALFGLGVPDRAIFALGSVLIVLAWVILGRVNYQPQPQLALE